MCNLFPTETDNIIFLRGPPDAQKRAVAKTALKLRPISNIFSHKCYLVWNPDYYLKLVNMARRLVIFGLFLYNITIL